MMNTWINIQHDPSLMVANMLYSWSNRIAARPTCSIHLLWVALDPRESGTLECHIPEQLTCPGYAEIDKLLLVQIQERLWIYLYIQASLPMPLSRTRATRGDHHCRLKVSALVGCPVSAETRNMGSPHGSDRIHCLG